MKFNIDVFKAPIGRYLASLAPGIAPIKFKKPPGISPIAKQPIAKAILHTIPIGPGTKLQTSVAMLNMKSCKSAILLDNSVTASMISSELPFFNLFATLSNL